MIFCIRIWRSTSLGIIFDNKFAYSTDVIGMSDDVLIN